MGKKERIRAVQITEKENNSKEHSAKVVKGDKNVSCMTV